MNHHQILVVEDDAPVRNLITTTLKSQDYRFITAINGESAVMETASHNPDIILLDLGLPDMDGMDIISAVRSWTSMPIIVVSARSYERDKVQALDKGADDYVTKPFSPAELLARVRVALRHTRSGPGSGAIANTGKFTAGELTIDYDKHQVLIAGENCRLTQNEYKIVALLGKCAGKVLTYDFIMKELWGPQSKGNNQILRVNMANIRRKIEKNPAEPQYIFTEVGVGYRMIEGD